MKKFFALLLAVMAAAFCLPVIAVEPADVNPIGQSFAGFEANVIAEGGNPGDTVITVDDFADYQVIFINIWSSGCGPCIVEMPYFQQLHDNYESEGVLVMGAVSTWINGTYAAAWNHLQSQGYTYLNVIQDSVIYDIYSQNNYVPQTFICNNEGTIVDFIGGGTTYDVLQQKAEFWLNADTELEVTFVDGLDGTVLDTQVVSYGTAAVPPEPPVHEGYNFTGWDTDDYQYVTENLTVTALYNKRTYRVRFYDMDGETVLKTEYVQYQNAATPPTPPTHVGYTFVGWDGDYSCITGHTNIYAIYEASGGGDGDVDGDGVLTAGDALIVLRYAVGGESLTPEQLAQADFNGDGVVDSADVLLILRTALE